MNALAVMNGVPAYNASLAKWQVGASYQLENAATYQAGNPTISWDHFNTPFSEILDKIRDAVIADALTNFSVTLTADNISIFSHTEY